MDQRTPSRRARDEQIAAEPQLAPPELPPDAVAASLEDQLARHRQGQDDKDSDQPDAQFREAADYVLKKNAELYRRLA